MSKSIKDLLKDGDKTPDELRAILEKEIEEAEKEKENGSIGIVRNDLALSLIRYGEALGLDLDIEISEAAALLEGIEPELKKYIKILKILVEDLDLGADDKKDGVEPTYEPYSLSKFSKNKNKNIDDRMNELVAKLMKDIVK